MVLFPKWNVEFLSLLLTRDNGQSKQTEPLLLAD